MLTGKEITQLYEAGIGGESLQDLLDGGACLGFRITNITYDSMGTPANRSDDMISLTWPSKEGAFYGIYYTTDLGDWDTDLDAGYMADPGDSTTYTFPATDIGDPVLDRVFFRIQR